MSITSLGWRDSCIVRGGSWYIQLGSAKVVVWSGSVLGLRAGRLGLRLVRKAT